MTIYVEAKYLQNYTTLNELDTLTQIVPLKNQY